MQANKKIFLTKSFIAT